MKKTLRRLSIVLFSLLMVLSLTACSGGSSDEPTGKGSASTGEYQTTFVYGIGGEPDYLDPATFGDSVTSYVVNQTVTPLLLFGEDGSSVPVAVTDYEISDDGLVYTLHIRDDIYWSDGELCTAEHYVYGAKRSLGFTVADAYYSYFIRDYVLNAGKYGVDGPSAVADMDDVGIVALDDTTIEITLKEPCDYFLSLLTSNVFYAARPDFAIEGDETWADNPHPCNGAFVYETIDNTTRIVMVKNEHYWDADNVVIERLEAVVMADPDAQLMAFQTGEIDFATNIEAAAAYALYDGSDELYLSDAVINYYVSMNSYRDDALSNRNVRRAIQLCIDRANIVAALDSGELYYELYGFVPVGMPGVDGDFRTEQDETHQLVYTDKDEARALMEAEGYSETNRLSLTYTTNQAAMHSTVAQVVAQELSEIYIDVTIETQEIRVFFENRSNGLTQLARGAFSADYMDPMTYLGTLPTYYQDVVTSSDEHYDELLDYANSLTGEERMQALHDAENYYIEDGAYSCPLFGYRNLALRKAGTTGISSNPQGNHLFIYAKVPA